MQNLIIKPAFNKNNLGIVFATDANYLPYMAVSIQSIIDHADPNYNYDFLVFDDGITSHQKELLSVFNTSHSSIRFIDVKPLLQTIDASLFKSRGIWSAAACYRLFIPQILSGYDKVLYLDCDVAVKDSLVDLFKVNLDGYAAGCIYDTIRYTADRQRISDINEYVKIKDWRNYFNSGVVLFNLKEIDAKRFSEEFLAVLQRPYLPFLDQDALNILWEDKFKPLDGKWNYQYYILIDHPELIENEELASAQQNRRIIHYISHNKPWNSPQLPHADEWWASARKTPFYEEIIYKNTRISNALLRNLKHYRRLYCKYIGYKFLQKISFGKLSHNLGEKLNKIKQQIKAVRAVYREK